MKGSAEAPAMAGVLSTQTQETEEQSENHEAEDCGFWDANPWS